MNKKLFTIFLTILCTIVLLCGLGVFSTSSQDLLKQRSLQQILDDADNEVALEKALTVEYSLDDFKEFEESAPSRGLRFLTAIRNPLNSFPSVQEFTLSEVNQNFPIEVLRCVPNSVLTQQDSSAGTPWYYAVYKIDQGGYLYCFFYGVKETAQSSSADNYYMYFTLYAKKTLTARQLDSVVEGDSLQQVRSAAGEMVLYPDFGNSPYSFSIHLLEDDLLAYVYDGDDNIIAKFSWFEPIPQQYKEENKDCFVLQYGHLMLERFSSVPILPQDMP